MRSTPSTRRRWPGGGEGGRAAPEARQAAAPRADRAPARPRQPVPRAVAAGRLGIRVHRRRERGHRGRRDRGRRVRADRQRPDGPRRRQQPVDAEEDPAGDADRPGEPAAADQPGRVRRRGPAHPEGDLHPGRADLPRPHPALGGRHPDDRAGLRQLHRRRRLRARHERPRGDGRRRREGLPRRPAAGADGHRRDRRRGGARRRRHARPGERAGRPRRRRRAGRAPDRTADRGPAQLAQARAGASPSVPPRYAEDELLGIVGADLSQPFDPREVLARIVDDSDVDEVKPRYGPAWSPRGRGSTGIRSASWPTRRACCSARRRRRRPSSSSWPTRPTPRWSSCTTPPATWSAGSTSRPGSSSTAR